MKSPLITMSAVTGKPTVSDMERYLTSLHKNGIDQVMLYPRSGCELEYLGEEWFDTVGEALKVAEKLDMYIWLYDDFNWPSGDANGRVSKIPEYRLKSIKIKGENKGKITVGSSRPSALFAEKFYPDLMSEKAVDYFIECTHEQYYKRFAKYFGSTIKGIFTDEPSLTYSCPKESVPYYDGMEKEYAERFGRDFDEDIRNGYELLEKNTCVLIGDRFGKCFVKKIADWCESHGIFMTGHLMSDSTPRDAVRQTGEFITNLSGFSVPGIDDIRTNFGDPELVSLLSSAEYASGENGAMAELFALGPTDISYGVKRCMIYLASCFKIDKYFLAVSHMDQRGNKLISDYFNEFSTDQPDFSGTILLSEEAKIASEYAKKDFTPDVYVKYPTDTLQKRVLDPPSSNPIFTMVNSLSENQIQWKYITDNDAPGDIPVIDFGYDLEYIFGDLVTKDESVICEKLAKKPFVTDTECNKPNGVFVRQYDDGSFVVMNYKGDDGIFVVDGKEVFLGKHDVVTDKTVFDAVPVKSKQNIMPEFTVSYCNNNIIRAMYINSETNFEMDCENTLNIRFAIRNDVSATLDGKDIKCIPCTDELPEGFAKLYNISESITLEKGRHILGCGNDIKYLPSVFIIGDFTADTRSDTVCGVVLRKREASYAPGKYFLEYGRIELTAELDIPENVCAIELTGTSLLTSISLDGKDIGEKICSPYVFPIDSSLRGKRVRLGITQYSSLGPAFGDVAYFDKVSENVKWRGTPSTSSRGFGIGEINFVIE